jgi:hypothetical protein
MARKKWRRAIALTASLCGLAAGNAWASGPGEPAPHYLDQFGGSVTDLKAVWDGRIGVVMARAPRPELYLKWRLLHGLAVGPDAGAALSKPCCDATSPFAPPQARDGWIEARKLVIGAPDLPRPWIDTERPVADGVSVPNCFDDAFVFATQKLKDRIRDHGASDANVRAWLATQDAVFAACSSAAATLPALAGDAPAWLKADRAYQEAAFALYAGRAKEAAQRFTDLGRDRTSPYRSLAPYLAARVLWREALNHRSPTAEADASRALDRLAASGADAYGRAQVTPLRESLQVRLHPDIARPRLERAILAPEASADLAVRFRDLSDLSDSAVAHGGQPAEVVDWIATLKGAVPKPPAPPEPTPPAPPEPQPQAADNAPVDSATFMAEARAGRLKAAKEAAKTAEAHRREALAHAVARWDAGHDRAWLLAAISLANPGDAEAPALSTAANAVEATYPGWLTLEHHLIRLGWTSRPAADNRARLDQLLSRPDLSTSDRNLFLGARSQVAASLDDFLAHALRQRVCSGDGPARCARDDWSTDSYQSGGVFDGEGSDGTVGLGDEARAVLDRLPLAQRMSAAADPLLPPRLRLDLDLTNFARAVDLQDAAAIDAVSNRLEALLPLMAADFAAIRKARPGPDKRFAEFFVLAKIPGLRTDLVEYTRPEGRTVSDFQGYWTDWIVFAKGRPLLTSAPPDASLYQRDGQGAEEGWPDSQTDLTCLGECQAGAQPLRLPDFAAKVQTAAGSERGYFLRTPQSYYDAGKTNPPLDLPKGAVSAWEEMLAYVTAHPKDPRAPEALYWLVHVGHFGGSHAHSGRRAFKLLKARYAASVWAVKTKYYYD